MMPKRVNEKGGRLAFKASRAKAPLKKTPGARRLECLVELVDHCTAAKGMADDLDEKFLAYLLAMAIQETRSAMRQQADPAY